MRASGCVVTFRQTREPCADGDVACASSYPRRSPSRRSPGRRPAVMASSVERPYPSAWGEPHRDAPDDLPSKQLRPAGRRRDRQARGTAAATQRSIACEAADLPAGRTSASRAATFVTDRRHIHRVQHRCRANLGAGSGNNVTMTRTRTLSGRRAICVGG